MNRKSGNRSVFGIGLDGLDHQVQFVGAVDFPGHAVILVWRDELGFGEVMQPVNPAGRVISHNEHSTTAIFRPREQEQMIGAEVEHTGRNQKESGNRSSRPLSAPLRGYPADSSGPGYRH